MRRFLYLLLLLVSTINWNSVNSQVCDFIDIIGPDTIYIPCDSTKLKLRAGYLNIQNSSSYGFGTIPYYNYAYNGTSVNSNVDDVWSVAINLPDSFRFCFYNNFYNQLIIGSNGIVSFPPYGFSNPPGGFCPWALTTNGQNIPISNCIMSPYHDIDPSVDISPNIFYRVYDTFPCRKFVISYSSPMFQCNGMAAAHQIVLHETSNIIDINILNKPLCNTWNGGAAILGIKGGLAGTFVPGHDYPTQWVEDSISYRFIPSGVTNVNSVIWYELPSGIQVNIGDTLMADSGFYMVEVIYNSCNGLYSLYDSVYVDDHDLEFGNGLVIYNSCYGDSSASIFQSVNGIGTNYTWGGDIAQIGGNMIDSLSYGIYSLNVTDTFGCAIDTSYTIPFVDSIMANYTVTPVLCPGDSDGVISISANGSSPFNYNISSGSYVYNGSDSIFEGLKPGRYFIEISDSNGCLYNLTIVIDTPSDDVFSIIIDSISCFNGNDGSITINPGLNDITHYPYVYAIDNSTYEYSNQFYNLGSGYYMVSVINSNMCFYDSLVYLSNPLEVSAYIDPNHLIVNEGDIINSQVVVNTIGNITWTPSDGIDCNNCSIVNISVLTGISDYMVVVENNGCYDTAYLHLDILNNSNIYIPNVFSPNGDGINDVFQIYSNDSEYINIMIFNRWGEKVFESSKKGWDGKYKEVLQDPQVFVYSINIDGIIYKGSITLIR